MLYVLTHNILPVFALLALGFAMGRTGTAKQDEARAINRIAFLVLQPPLVFMLLTGLDLSAIRLDALALYVAVEVICFVITYNFARRICGSAADEAFLLGMCVTFVNSLMYVWPIATLIYGEAGALPIAAIVAFEASVSFAFFIVGSELIAGKEGAAAAALPKDPAKSGPDHHCRVTGSQSLGRTDPRTGHHCCTLCRRRCRPDDAFRHGRCAVFALHAARSGDHGRVLHEACRLSGSFVA